LKSRASDGIAHSEQRKACRDNRPYAGEPVSEFQQQVRGGESELKDHICKTMNELNMRRCELVPKNVPGADWRSLVLHVEKHPEDALFKVRLQIHF
jgi:hypothetical protein